MNCAETIAAPQSTLQADTCACRCACCNRHAAHTRRFATQRSPMPCARTRVALGAFTRLAAGLLLCIAVADGALLLMSDAGDKSVLAHYHAVLAAAPLICAGLAVLILEHRPPLARRVKATLVALAFVLWGVDKLLAAGPAATVVGDVVIILFTLDVAWLLAERVRGGAL